MLVDIVRKITPRGLRIRVGGWLDSKLVRSRLLTSAFYYFLYGIVVRIKPMPDGNCLVASLGTEMIIPGDSVPVFIEIFRDCVYEQFSSPEEGDIVIDVGAHVGIFTVKAAKLVGDSGLVVTIEPEPRNLALLQRNIESHSLTNVKIVSKAALNEKGTVRLYLQDLSVSHSLSRQSGDYIEVEADSLDNIISKLELDRVDFVKMDVEGAELETLKGAEKVLASPGIKLSIASYHVLPDGQPQLPGIISYLKSRQFRTQIYIKGSCPYVYATK